MDIEIEPLSPVPIYQQIRDRIVEGIASGRLARGDGLASVRSLAGALRTNPATVAKAYDQLRAEGLVATNAKSGSFIARDRESGQPEKSFVGDWTDRLTTLLAEGRAQGLPAERVLESCAGILEGFSSGRAAETHTSKERQ